MNKIHDLITYLSQFVSEDRYDLFEKVLDQRTRYITVALENIYQPQNASAVLRTSDCFGLQDVHIIENDNAYNINPDVALGSYKWLDLMKYNALENNTLTAISALRKKGYRIVATTPHTQDVNLHDFDLTAGKCAFFFGTELNGLTKEMMDNADEYMKIPMYGFTESFNISVSASIILHHLTHKLRNTDINWQLSTSEKSEIMLRWLKTSIKKVHMIINDYSERTGIDYNDFI